MVAENDGKTSVWRVIYVDGKLVGNISVELRQDVYVFGTEDILAVINFREQYFMGELYTL